MASYAQGVYTVKNPAKYVGKKAPKYRSSWELRFMLFCDNNPSIINWASESIMIPYVNPVTGKNTVYVPDFFIYYMDKSGKKVGEIIEIKPKKEMTLENAKSQRDKIMVAINMAKWQAATKWCKAQGLTFRVINEDHIFMNNKK